jgi:3-oxoacyl-[acyl-carrier-protein] synthase-3
MEQTVRAAIAGIGGHVPPRVLTNEDFEKFLDTSDEWITQRTGIKERRVVSEGETTLTMSVEAAQQALESAKVKPTDLDLIILATITPEMPFPATACMLQKELGAKDVPAFDISAACSGFIYALIIGDQFIKTGMYKNVLVVGVDIMTHYSDYTDRTSCILFGDGAGAAVLQATAEDNRGIQYGVMHADGEGWDYIYAAGGGTRNPTSHETVDARMHYVTMKGREVYKFAVEKMQWLLGDCMKKCNLTPDDVTMVIPHQVNVRIIKSAAERHNFPLEKVYMNIYKYGNTSAASVPLALYDAVHEGKITRGSTVILIAFGGGLSCVGAVLKY